MKRVFYLFALCIALAGIHPVYAQSENTQILENIRNAYEDLDFSVAEARIEAALAVYERFSPSELSDLHTLYALLYFARNEIDAAERQLDQALQLTPTMQLDSLETPPQLLELFANIKKNYQSVAAPSSSTQEVRYLIIQDPRPAAALRSMMIPGWGQLYKGESQKGWLLIGMWGATAGGTILSHINRKRAEDRYLNAITRDQISSRFKTFDTWHKLRNNLALGALGVWVYSYLDAIVKGEPTTPQQPPQSFRITPAHSVKGFVVTWRF